MNKRYYLYYIKKLLPMAFIVLGIFLLVTLVSGANTSSYYKYYVTVDSTTGEEFFYKSFSADSGLATILSPAIAFSFVLPFILFSYRYKKENADLYRQMPLRKNELTITRSLVGLTILGVILTASFFLLMSIVLIKGAVSQTYEAESGSDHYVLYKAATHYGWYYLLGYPFFMLINFSVFGFSSYFCNKANSILEAIFGNIITLIALSIGFIVFYLYLSLFGAVEAANTLLNNAPILGPIGEGISYFSIFHSLIMNGYVNGLDSPSGAVFLIVYTFNILLGIGAFVCTLFEREPSGDKYGGHGYRGISANIVFIVMVSILMLLASTAVSYLTLSSSLFLVGILIYIHAAVLCFFFFVMLNRGLNIGKLHFIIYALVAGIPLILGIFAGLLNING